MKKHTLTLLLLTFISTCYLFGQQNAIELKIKKAVYEIETSSLTIDLEFKNTSSDTLYLIKPQNTFFDKHYQFDVIDYPQLSAYPYSIIIESNNKCSEESIVRMIQNLNGEKSIDNDDIFIIYPREKKVFKNIIIEYEDIKFCNIGKYSVKILYNFKLESTTLPLTENDKKIIYQLNKMGNKIETNLIKCSGLKASKESVEENKNVK